MVTLHIRKFFLIAVAVVAIAAHATSWANDKTKFFEDFTLLNQMTPVALNTALTKLRTNLYSIISTKDRDVYLRYSEIMTAIAENPKFANVAILETLMEMSVTQDHIFGVPEMLYWSTRFDTQIITFVARRFLQHLANSPDTNAGDIAERLLFRATLVGNSLTPKFNISLAPDFYEFAVKKRLVADTETLVQIIKMYADEIFDDGGRSASIASSFLVAHFGYTLSGLKDAKDSDILYIMHALKQPYLSIAYEELVRSGRLSRMSAEQVLVILELANAYIASSLNNPSFEQSYKDEAKAAAVRIKQMSTVFAGDFDNKKPTKAQISSFIQLSGFGLGQYTLARLKRHQLPEPDYSLNLQAPTSSCSGILKQP